MTYMVHPVCMQFLLGKTPRECQHIYLRLKDQLFEGWVRPYSTAVLEDFIKREMSETTTLGDIQRPRIIITTVNDALKIRYWLYYYSGES